MSILENTKYSQVMNNRTPSWEQQASSFGGSGNYDGLASNFAQVAVPVRSWEDESALWDNTPNYGVTTGTGSDFASKAGTEGGFMEGLTSTLGNRDLMSGLTGVGQLGLGLANYLQMKPMYEEQLKALKQNIDIQKDRYESKQRAGENFDNALR